MFILNYLRMDQSGISPQISENAPVKSLNSKIFWVACYSKITEAIMESKYKNFLQ